MIRAKMILQSTNSGNLRGARAASSLGGQSVAPENRLCPAPRSSSPSSPPAFFRSSQNKNTNASLRELSLDFVNEPSNRSATTSSSSTSHIHVSVPSRSSRTSTELSPPMPTSPPLLLLQGDNYHFSHDGVTRTMYRMRLSDTHSLPSTAFSVEELYDLQNAKKTFVLRQDCPPVVPTRKINEEIIAVGEAIQELDLQEIKAGMLRGAGTGANTWESSIVMAMYFATHPELLKGDVVELGSGVGLGGILCALGLRPGPGEKGGTQTRSLTLTDVNPMVLEQCLKNVESVRDTAVSPLRVSKLDWCDFLPHDIEKPLASSQLFDTVIACDCAYRQGDIAALAATMTSLLRNEHSQIHIFGPSNRTGLDKLLTILHEDDRLSVSVQPLEMERYRLRPQSNENCLSGLVDSSVTKGLECFFATSSLSQFLHITCSPKKARLKANENLSDID